MLGRIAHLQEQAVSSEGLYCRSIEILDTIPKFDLNIWWDIYGNVYY